MPASDVIKPLRPKYQILAKMEQQEHSALSSLCHLLLVGLLLIGLLLISGINRLLVDNRLHLVFLDRGGSVLGSGSGGHASLSLSSAETVEVDAYNAASSAANSEESRIWVYIPKEIRVPTKRAHSIAPSAAAPL